MKKILTLCLVFVILMSGFTTVLGATSPSVDKAEGNISAAAGEFKITFAENVTKEMLDTISFKKKSGEILVDIKGGAFAEVDSTNPKIAVVKYGILENKTDYVLTVGNDTYDYRVVTAEFKEDFEADSFVVGNQLPTRPATVTEPVIYFPSTDNVPSGKATGAAECHYIGETADGDKYVALDPNVAGKGKNGRLVLEFPQPVTDDTICIDMKVRVNGTYAQSRNILFAFLAAGNVANTNKCIVGASAGSTIAAPANTLMGGAANTSFKASKNIFSKVGADGFYDLRMYLQRNADGSYKSSTQNLNAPKEGELTVEGTAANLTGIYTLWLTQFYAEKDTTTGISLDLSEVSVKASYKTDILHIDDIEKTDAEIGVVFTNDINAETLSALTMKDAEDNPVEITFDRYDETARKAYYKIDEVLKADATYTIAPVGVKDVDGLDATSTPVAVKTQPEKYALAVPTVVESDNIITYSNTISAEAGKKFTLVLVIFDRNDRLVDVVPDTKTVAAGQTSVTLSAVTPEGIDINDGYYIKPYIWEEDAVGGNAFVSVPDEIR